MRRLTQRGWGQFKPYDIDLDAGRARVRIDNSAFVDDERPAGRRVCYMFAAWFEGALEYSASATGRTLRLQAGEMYCVAEGTHDHCMFEISAR